MLSYYLSYLTDNDMGVGSRITLDLQLLWLAHELSDLCANIEGLRRRRYVNKLTTRTDNMTKRVK